MTPSVKILLFPFVSLSSKSRFTKYEEKIAETDGLDRRQRISLSAATQEEELPRRERLGRGGVYHRVRRVRECDLIWYSKSRWRGKEEDKLTWVCKWVSECVREGVMALFSWWTGLLERLLGCRCCLTISMTSEIRAPFLQMGGREKVVAIRVKLFEYFSIWPWPPRARAFLAIQQSVPYWRRWALRGGDELAIHSLTDWLSEWVNEGTKKCHWQTRRAESLSTLASAWGKHDSNSKEITWGIRCLSPISSFP